MSVEYTPAPAVEAIATRLIKKHHAGLVGERIEYVFRSEAASQGGKTVMGKARKVGGLNAYLASGETGDGAPFFVLEEFDAIVRRHGLWKPDVSRFIKAAGEQLRLLEDE